MCSIEAAMPSLVRWVPFCRAPGVTMMFGNSLWLRGSVRESDLLAVTGGDSTSGAERSGAVSLPRAAPDYL